MGRQEAKTSLHLQDFHPWDAETAPPVVFPTHGKSGILTALRDWEKRRGLAIDFRGHLDAEIRGALKRRRILQADDDTDPTP